MNLLEPKTQFRPRATLQVTEVRGGATASSTAPFSPLEAVRLTLAGPGEAELRPVASPKAGLAFQPRALLAVTLYCYLHEIYGSEDIENALRRDVLFRELCQQEFPDARLIRRFRRQNRDPLQRALTTALQLSLPPEFPHAVVVEEARSRIGTAMFIDSMESAD